VLKVAEDAVSLPSRDDLTEGIEVLTEESGGVAAPVEAVAVFNEEA
jgi:hypothetical protein